MNTLDKLNATLQERKNADASESYVASLYAKGTEKICGKLAEETAETIFEAARGDREKLKQESADLLFHLMVLWAHMDVTPEEVYEVLEGRFGTGGHEEKARRAQS